MSKIIDKLKAKYPNGFELGYVDYRDDLSENTDIICMILSGDHDKVVEKIYEWYMDNRYEYVDDIVAEVFGDEELSDEDRDKARDYIYENDNFDPIEQLLKNTGDVRVRLTRKSNYEFINKDWETSEAYLDMIKTLKGKMTKKEINETIGKERDYICSDYGTICFSGTIDLLKCWKTGGVKKIKVLAGTQYGLINTRSGTCGDMDGEVKKDFVIDTTKTYDSQYDRWDLELDSEGGYGLDEICGYTSDFWERGGFVAVE